MSEEKGRIIALNPRPARGDGQRLTFGHLQLYRRGGQVRLYGRSVGLTAREFGLLWFLANHPWQPFTAEQLTYRIWPTDYLGDAASIKVLFERIRKKLGPFCTCLHLSPAGAYYFTPPVRSRVRSAR